MGIKNHQIMIYMKYWDPTCLDFRMFTYSLMHLMNVPIWRKYLSLWNWLIGGASEVATFLSQAGRNCQLSTLWGKQCPLNWISLPCQYIKTLHSILIICCFLQLSLKHGTQMPRNLSNWHLWRREQECEYGFVTYQILDHEIIMIGLDGLPANWKN